MDKRMQDKESIAGLSWIVVLVLACWGGLVRYLIDVKQNKATWSWINALAQIAVSGFTGVIGGLVSVESGLSLYMILAAAGVSGAMGSVALTYFWERLTGMKNANQ
ncbi:holin [Enterobacter hormaechei]|nr:holin [Enterobacter hormaechei]